MVIAPADVKAATTGVETKSTRKPGKIGLREILSVGSAKCYLNGGYHTPVLSSQRGDRAL